MSSLYRKLCTFCEERKLIEIYNKIDESGTFGLGVLICVSQTDFIYSFVDKQGRLDGIRIEAIDDIWKIVEESSYINKFKRIISEEGYDLSVDGYSNCFNNEKFSMMSFLQYSADTERAVTVYFSEPGGSELLGCVAEIDDGIIKFKEVDKYDGAASVTYINIDDIYACSCGSKNERIAEVPENV